MSDFNPDSAGNVLELPIPPGKKASDYVGAYKGIAYAAISAIASDVASIQLHLYQKKVLKNDVKIDEVQEHEALSLLHNVNDYSSFYDLMEATAVFLETNGESFWLIIRDAMKRPSEIWPLRPDWISIIPDKQKVIKAYRYKPGGLADFVDFDPQDIIHFKSFNPKTMQRGMGSIQAAAMELDLDDFAAGWSRNFFFNSAVPSLLLKFKDKLSEETIKRFISRWESSFRGMQQSHKIAVISGNVETEHLSADVDKLGLIEQRKYFRDQILAIFQVPKSILGITEDVNRANAEATIRAYMERVVKPRMMKLVGQLNEFYLRLFTGTENMFFDFNDPTPADRELDLKVYENGLKNGWLTINEVREEENYPPVEGGDSIYLPFNLQPITDAGGATPPTKSMKNGYLILKVKGTKKKEQHFHVMLPHKKLQEVREAALKRKLKPKVAKLMANIVALAETEHKKEAIWKQMIAKTDVWEEQMKSKVTKLFNEQEDIVNSKVEQKKKKAPTEAELGKFLFGLLDETEKWDKELEPLFKKILKEQGRDTLDFLGIGGDLDLSQKNVAKFLKYMAGTLIKGINEVTLGKLRETLAEGVVAGEGIDSLKGRVTTVFEDARGERAEKIARTETLRATNFATNEAYVQSKVVKGKEWLTALDERVCEICQPLDGVAVDLNKNFSTDVGAVDYPPAHPSCRCTTIPVIV